MSEQKVLTDCYIEPNSTKFEHNEKNEGIWIKNLIVVKQVIEIDNKNFLIEQTIPVSVLVLPNNPEPKDELDLDDVLGAKDGIIDVLTSE